MGIQRNAELRSARRIRLRCATPGQVFLPHPFQPLRFFPPRAPVPPRFDSVISWGFGMRRTSRVESNVFGVTISLAVFAILGGLCGFAVQFLLLSLLTLGGQVGGPRRDQPYRFLGRCRWWASHWHRRSQTAATGLFSNHESLITNNHFFLASPAGTSWADRGGISPTGFRALPLMGFSLASTVTDRRYIALP